MPLVSPPGAREERIDQEQDLTARFFGQPDVPRNLRARRSGPDLIVDDHDVCQHVKDSGYTPSASGEGGHATRASLARLRTPALGDIPVPGPGRDR